MKTCFFVGHHDAPWFLQERLNAEVERLVRDCAVSEFVVGHYGDFDRMATIAVQAAKKRHPNLRAYRLIPYFPSGRSFPVPEYFDNTLYPEGMETVPKRYCILRANRKLIDTSDYLLAYVCHEGGNAGGMLAYAKRREKRGLLQIINLADLPGETPRARC